MAAQVLGAFVGGALIYLVYHDAISSFEAARHITRGALGGAADSTPTFSIFATFPAPYFGSSRIGPLIDQIVGPFIGGVLGAVVYDLFVGDVLRARKEPPAPDVEGFGETVEERPTTADDGQVEARGRTVRER